MSMKIKGRQAIYELLDAADAVMDSPLDVMSASLEHLRTAVRNVRIALGTEPSSSRDTREWPLPSREVSRSQLVPNEIEIEIEIDRTDSQQTPTYAHEDDVGADLRAADAVVIDPGETKIVPTGIKVALPWGVAGLVCARSGLGIKHRLALPHGVGVIDGGYRGDVSVALANDGKDRYSIAPGERIAQLLFVPVLRARWKLVAALPSSARGADGFGSTGK